MRATFGFEFEFQDGPEEIMDAVAERDYDSDCSCGECDRRGDSNYAMPLGLELQEDGSVDGGEITTVGGLTPKQFLGKFEEVLALGSFRVDTGCSFHIHVGGDAVRSLSQAEKHIYQAEALTFLLVRFGMWPDRVKDRFTSESRQEYFNFSFGRDKMIAIRAHPQKTMEFRLWGNVASLADASKCLLLTRMAHRHAIAVVTGRKTGLWREHMHSYFSGGSKGVEWILDNDDVMGRARMEFNWTAFEDRCRRWSAKVMGRETDKPGEYEMQRQGA